MTTNNSKISLSNIEFEDINSLIYNKCGIHIEKEQLDLLEHKLSKRLKVNNLKSFSLYYEKLLNNPSEIQEMINAVTINETSFFREMKHFEFLQNIILPSIKYDTFRCWSAAGSNGAELYSIAMILDKCITSWQNYEIVYSDINSEVLKDATNAIYPIKYLKTIPIDFLKQYCRCGIDENDGLFAINDKLKKNVKFMLLNLTMPLFQDEIDSFDVIFLRNMIIYFDERNKK